MSYEDSQILNFYGWWQFGTCFFAFLGLMAIWYHIGRKQKDFGQVWLALSILCWSMSGLMEVYYAFQLGPQWNDMPQNFQQHDVKVEILKANLAGWRSILSLLNSLFILLALPWFRHLPSFLEQIIKSKYWYLIVGLPFVFSLLPTLSKLFTGSSTDLIRELDVYYSVLTLLVLGVVLWESFTKRRLKMLAILSVVCILIIFTAQIYKLTDHDINQVLFSAIFKTSLIMIFFALALSWVKDLVEKVQISGSDIQLILEKKKSGKSWINAVKVTGLTKEDKSITLTNKNFELLSSFVSKRQSIDGGWLEIKPKSDSRTGKTYDINDHNEIKRLLHSILDGVYGKGLWSKSEHEIPIKEVIFEMSSDRERKIRLNIPKENLTIV